MVDPEDWAWFRWRALWIAREYRLAYTYGEHVLLALLERPTPEVSRILQELGEDPSTLRIDVERFAESLAPARRSSSGWGQDTEIENAAWHFAQEDGYYKERPEHLLLAIASPVRHGWEEAKLTEAGQFLVNRGIEASALRTAIKPPEEAERGPKTYERPLKSVWVIEGWKAAAARINLEQNYRTPSQYEFSQLLTQLRSAEEWALLAHVYEMLATARLLDYRSAPLQNSLEPVARHLIMAALWLRKAGDQARARLIAERAIYELQTVYPDGRPHPEKLQDPIHVAFALEMMGDAALCVDPHLAKTYWLRALEEFQYIDSTTQCAEWNEPYFHGWYLSESHHELLPNDPDNHGADGQARITAKLAQWI